MKMIRIRKSSFILSIIILLGVTVVTGQADSKNNLLQRTVLIPSRMSVQTRFCYSKSISDSRRYALKSVEGIDQFYEMIRLGWLRYLEDSLSVTCAGALQLTYKNIDPYVQMMLLPWAMGHTLNNDVLELHIYKKYIMPSLETDFELFTKNPTASNFQLLSYPAWTNFVAIGSEVSDHPETFEKFYNLFEKVTNLLTNLDLNDSLSVNHAKRMLKVISDYELNVKTRKLYLSGRVNAALELLLGGLPQEKYYKLKISKFGRQLSIHFASGNERDKSFTILDSLAVYASGPWLPLDSLRQDYLQVDKNEGLSRYVKIVAVVPANDFRLSNEWVSLGDYKNFIVNGIDRGKLALAKIIVLDFWYSTCGPCIAEIPKLNDLHRKFAKRTDILFISVNTDFINGKKNFAEVKLFAQRHGLEFPVIYENSTNSYSKALKINGYPAKFILDRTGRLIKLKNDALTSLNTLKHLSELSPESVSLIVNQAFR